MKTSEIYREADNEVDATLMLSEYIRGLANLKADKRLYCAAEIIKNYAREICGAGFLGCKGGKHCSSDHK